MGDAKIRISEQAFEVGQSVIRSPKIASAYIVLAYDDGTQTAFLATAENDEGMKIHLENTRPLRGGVGG